MKRRSYLWIITFVLYLLAIPFYWKSGSLGVLVFGFLPLWAFLGYLFNIAAIIMTIVIMNVSSDWQTKEEKTPDLGSSSTISHSKEV